MKKWALVIAAALALVAGVPVAQTVYDSGPAPLKGGQYSVDFTGRRLTCSAAFDLAGYTTPTDLFSLAGSATKKIRLVHAELSGTATTSTSSDVLLVKRSTANTGGTPTTITPVKHDTQTPGGACTATIATYGSAPTLGTLVGAVKDAQLTLPPAASSTPALTYLPWDFGTHNEEPVALNGTAENVGLNFQGVAWPAGGKISVSLTWSEE